MALISSKSNVKPILLDTFYFQNKVHRLYLEKSYFPENGKDQYFLKLYELMSNGKNNCEGYIYFYLDELKKECSFIGLYVKPEARNLGIASLLIASWLKMCLERGFSTFTTNKKQRKPFLIYLLKKYGFEIEDVTEYKKSDFTIELYRSLADLQKYLLFKTLRHKETFLQSSIAKEDNYVAIDTPGEDLIWLDEVLQSTPYYLQDDNEAYSRSRRKIKQYQK